MTTGQRSGFDPPETNLHIAVAVLSGRLDGVEGRMTRTETTLQQMDAKLDKIAELLAERDGITRGVIRVISAIGAGLSVAAAWFSGVIHFGGH